MLVQMLTSKHLKFGHMCGWTIVAAANDEGRRLCQSWMLIFQPPWNRCCVWRARVKLCSFNRSTDDETGRRQWISKHCEAFWCWIAEHHTESLDDKKPARVWGHCPFPECKATTSSQLRYKADQVVLTWFRNKVHDNQELPGSHKKCTKKSWYSRLQLSPEDTAIRSCVTWSRFTAAAAT